MRYVVTFQDKAPAQNPGRPDIDVVNAHWLPRVGETIEIGGEEFTVIHVFHVAGVPEEPAADVPPMSRASFPVVRVR